MKKTVRGTQIDIEANSKPYLFKHIIADGFDTVLILILFMCLTALFLRSPMAETYREHVSRISEISQEYMDRYGDDREAMIKAINEDEEYLNERFAANLRGYIFEALAALITEGIVLLAVPLLNKDKATPGKLMMSVMLFSESRQGKAKGLQILLRFLFVFFVDSLILYMFAGIFTFLLVPVIRLTEMLINKDNKTLLDLMTGLKVIEKLSYDGID